MFLTNTSDCNLSVKTGTFLVAVGESKPISDTDAQHESVLDAISKGWAKLTDEAVSIEKAVVAAVTSTLSSAPAGMTLEELKASQAAKVEVPATTSESIGVPAPVPTTEVPVAPAVEDPKKTSKTAK